MDFVALVIFLALYYLRPQEWYAGFNALRPVQLLSFMAVWAMFRANKLKPRDLVRTPLDWLMLCYFLWTLIAGGEFSRTLGGIEAVLLFYFVAVRSLDSIHRQKVFLSWWCAFMLIIAALAIASQYGFDPLGSNAITQYTMKGRLVLNLSIFNNPNALGHSIVPAVPLVYYLVFWRRTFMRAGLLLMAIPLYCIFLTQSKGAFLCGFATILATLTFGRSKIAQVAVVIVSIVFGYGALFALPRMNELNSAKTDRAIQGRVAALSYGYYLMHTHFFGIGLSNFQEMFSHYGPLEKLRVVRIVPPHDLLGNDGTVRHVGIKRLVTFRYQHFLKATHCAYNQNGAELGYVGLFLFVGILYCCIRTLLLVKCRDDDEERIRRALFATVVAYAVSCWMVDFCYRPTFFMFVAAISAFHRHLLRRQAEGEEPIEEKSPVPIRPWLRRLPPIEIPGIPLPGLAAPLAAGSARCFASETAPNSLTSSTIELIPVTTGGGGGRVLNRHNPKASIQETLRKKFIWTRLGIMDFLIMLALTYATILYWQHLIVQM
jgi:hypothetical protein